jgi:hypothetical protein
MAANGVTTIFLEAHLLEGVGAIMATKAEIPTLVGRALKTFQTNPNNRPGDPLPLDEIGTMIEDEIGTMIEGETGEKLYMALPTTSKTK